ncbi:type II secretion system F family protein [Vibrio atypicus]|uniref:type II secretion system F family protein n=1 Tax=Vibrio atypicus TaxID=558271 RepID=UPI00135B7B47|nr:type II secretion system F family protein [Vibrio atypicus]
MISSQLYVFLQLCSVFLGVVLIALVIFRLVKRKMFLTQFSLKSGSNRMAGFVEFVSEKVAKPAVESNNQEINDKFKRAGISSKSKWINFYMPIKYGALMLGCASIYIYSLKDPLSTPTLVALMASWLIACIILPDAILDARGTARISRVSRQLPYLLDLLAVCVQTGMTIESAMNYLSKEMAGFDRELAALLKKTNDRSRLVGMQKALDELYDDIPSSEMRSFVMTLKQSLQYGSSIYGVLTTLAGDIRDVQMLTLEEKIGKLAAKMSVPLILFIMIPIVILIAAPGILRMMSNV